MLHRIEEPAAADGIVGLRHSNALIERPGARKRARKREVAYDPAVSDLIINNKRVAMVLT